MTKGEAADAKLKEGLLEVNLELRHLRESRNEDREYIRELERRLHELDKQVAFLERDAKDRAKLAAQIWIVIAVAIISAIGSIISAFVARGKT